MRDPIFDLSTGEPLFPVGDDMAVDLHGNFKLRVGDGMVMDADTFETEFTSSWGDADDDL